MFGIIKKKKIKFSSRSEQTKIVENSDIRPDSGVLINNTRKQIDWRFNPSIRQAPTKTGGIEEQSLPNTIKN